jgi:hypothetical protein
MMIERLVRSIVALFLVCSVSLSLVRADHCDESRFTTGPVDRELAGVKLFALLPDAIAELGQPSRHRDFTGADYPEGSGEAEYIWEIEETQVTLYTMYRRDESSARVETTVSVEISGQPAKSDRKRKLLTTSRGLSLGAKRVDVEKRYGPLFLHEVLKGRGSLSYCWEDDTWLTFYFEKSRLVSTIHLLGSVE